MLSLPRAQVQFLVEELRSHKLQGVARKKKKKTRIKQKGGNNKRAEMNETESMKQ